MCVAATEALVATCMQLAQKCSAFRYMSCQKTCMPWVMAHHTEFLASLDRIRTLAVEDYVLFYKYMKAKQNFHWRVEQVFVLVLGCTHHQNELKYFKEVHPFHIRRGLFLESSHSILECTSNFIAFNETTMWGPSFEFYDRDNFHAKASGSTNGTVEYSVNFCQGCDKRIATTALRKASPKKFTIGDY